MELVPVWMQVVVALAAVITAVLAIYRKVIRPVARLIVLLDEIMPIVEALTGEVDEDGDEGMASHFARVRRIDKGVLSLTKRLDDVEVRLDNVEGKIADKGHVT